MTIAKTTTTGTKQLLAAGIETARLDTLVLVCDVTGKNRTHLLAHPELELTHEQLAEFKKLLKRRISHEPLAYIRGKTEFYGREFIITPDVLEPRPESEAMIEFLKLPSIRSTETPIIIDVGTGSGALAITAKLALPNATVFGIDIDPNCLEVARKNAAKNAAEVEFIIGDLLSDVSKFEDQQPLVILANLPYVPDNYPINQAASHEPKIALFGGPDGLDLYRILFAQLAKLRSRPITIMTESLASQHEALITIAATSGLSHAEELDLIQVFNN